MNITDLEGAVVLSNAKVFCQHPEVLSGFRFEETESFSKFRFTF